MAKKKTEKVTEPKQDSQEPKKLWLGSFTEEQDMLTFTFLWTSRKDLQMQCKDAIRNSKTVEEAA